MKNNNENLVKDLLCRQNAETNDCSETTDHQAGTPFVIALKEGHIAIAKTILESQVETKQVEAKGGKSIKSMLRHTDNDGSNVFHQAFVSPKREEATELLVSKLSTKEIKKFLTAKNIKHEGTPFHILAEQKDDETVKKIMDHLTTKDRLSPKDIMECMESRNQKGETPLHISAKCGHSKFVESILAIGDSDPTQMGRLLAETDK